MRPRRVVGRAALVGDAAGYVTKCAVSGLFPFFISVLLLFLGSFFVRHIIVLCVHPFPRHPSPVLFVYLSVSPFFFNVLVSLFLMFSFFFFLFFF